MKQSLAGIWQACMMTEVTDTPDALDLTMQLPGTTSQQGMGPLNEACP